MVIDIAPARNKSRLGANFSPGITKISYREALKTGSPSANSKEVILGVSRDFLTTY